MHIVTDVDAHTLMVHGGVVTRPTQQTTTQQPQNIRSNLAGRFIVPRRSSGRSRSPSNPTAAVTNHIRHTYYKMEYYGAFFFFFFYTL
jgi:hypothetical protein